MMDIAPNRSMMRNFSVDMIDGLSCSLKIQRFLGTDLM